MCEKDLGGRYEQYLVAWVSCIFRLVKERLCRFSRKTHVLINRTALRGKCTLEESPQKRIKGVHSSGTKGQPKLGALQVPGDSRDRIS